MVPDDNDSSNALQREMETETGDIFRGLRGRDWFTKHDDYCLNSNSIARKLE